MKLMLTLVLMLLSFQAVFSQGKTEKTLTHRVAYDTMLRPDYFIIDIGVAEYVKYEGKGKKSKSVFVPLDTVSKNLISELNKLGFSGPFKKMSIAEKNSGRYGQRAQYWGGLLFQVTYQFNLANRDSINYLFKEINKENLMSLVVTPRFYDTTLERAKEKLFATALSSAKEYAQKIVDSNNIKIIKQSNIHLGFGPEVNNWTKRYNTYGGQKEFVIDLDDIEYELGATYTYTYEDK